MAKNYGKWFGGAIGWAFGGPIGGLVGFSLGYLFDNATLTAVQVKDERSHPGDFTLSLMVLTAAVMRADERLLKSELDFVKKFVVQQYGEDMAPDVLKLLRELLKKDFNLAEVCLQIRSHLSHPERLQLMHFVVGIALSDGEFHPAEKRVIEQIASYFHISHKDLESLGAMFQLDNDRYYRILEIKPEASQEEIKIAYRKMAKKYHPDRLGDVGEDVKKAAVDKFRMVQEAYEKLSKSK
jgi:DnaJ like chaperone protein